MSDYNLSYLLQQLSTSQAEIYSKIGIFLEMSKNVDESGALYTNRCNVKLLDDSILYDVRLNASPNGGSFTKPIAGAYVIVTFLSKEDAFISLISNSDFNRIETVNATNTQTTAIEISNVEGQRTVNTTNVTEYTVKTTNNGSFSIIDNTDTKAFIIRDANKIRLGITNGNELIIDETGISILTSEGKIKIGNDLLTLKKIFDDIIDTLNTLSFTNTAPATLTPDAISKLSTLKTNIDNTFE